MKRLLMHFKRMHKKQKRLKRFVTFLWCY